MAKIVYPKFTTPRAHSGHCWLNKPDTKFVATGEYSAVMLFDPSAEGWAALMDELKKLTEAHFETQKMELEKAGKKGDAKKLTMVFPWSAEENAEGEETGRLKLKAKQKALITPKGKKPFKVTVKVFDAKKNLLTNPPILGKESVIRCIVEAVPYYVAKDKQVGISLRLRSVQLIDLVPYEGSDATGFDEEEDGYEGSDRDFQTPSTGGAAGVGGDQEEEGGEESFNPDDEVPF